jgi:hypothetical protein
MTRRRINVERELIKVCAMILYWPFGGSEFTIPYETAPMYGAPPLLELLVKWDEEETR